jgi:hypothetical protein
MACTLSKLVLAILHSVRYPPGPFCQGCARSVPSCRPPPAPPMYTQFHPRSPNTGSPTRAVFACWGGRHPRIGRGSQAQLMGFPANCHLLIASCSIFNDLYCSHPEALPEYS